MKDVLVAKLGLLKSEQQTAAVFNTIWVCTYGSGNIWNERPAFYNADTVNGIRLHDEVRVSIPKLGLESGEEVILTLTPCDDDLDACYLLAARVHKDELQ